ncbi:MAG: hypothetical protein II351_01715 [Clostridia bacterium]|nr:hypothetical protein [Clostridia bacterium]
MKKFLITILSLTLVVLIALGALRYFNNAPESIDGDWAVEINGETVIWTFKDGKITFSYQGNTAEASGSYRYADSLLHLTIDEDWAEYDSYNCAFRGNKMIITQNDSEDQLVFTRVED